MTQSTVAPKSRWKLEPRSVTCSAPKSLQSAHISRFGPCSTPCLGHIRPIFRADEPLEVETAIGHVFGTGHACTLSCPQWANARARGGGRQRRWWALARARKYANTSTSVNVNAKTRARSRTQRAGAGAVGAATAANAYAHAYANVHACKPPGLLAL